jgi:hypothetical protein
MRHDGDCIVMPGSPTQLLAITQQFLEGEPTLFDLGKGAVRVKDNGLQDRSGSARHGAV